MIDDAINYSELRQNLKSVLDKVCDDSLALLVKRRNGKDIVILSKDDYEGETAYLLKSPKNAKRLREGLKTPLKDYIKVDIEQMKKELGS